MDISKVNNNLINNTIDNTKNKVTDDSFKRRLQSALDQNDKKQLKKVCQEFESIMLSMMYKQMKATVPKSDLIPGDAGKDIFESMLDENLVQEASKRGSFGLGEMLYKQMSKQLESRYNMVQGVTQVEQPAQRTDNISKTQEER